MRAQLVVTLEDDASVSISGPEDYLAALGLLELGRQAIQKHAAKQAIELKLQQVQGHQSGLVVVRGNVPGLKGA